MDLVKQLKLRIKMYKETVETENRKAERMKEIGDEFLRGLHRGYAASAECVVEDLERLLNQYGVGNND